MSIVVVKKKFLFFVYFVSIINFAFINKLSYVPDVSLTIRTLDILQDSYCNMNSPCLILYYYIEICPFVFSFKYYLFCQFVKQTGIVKRFNNLLHGVTLTNILYKLHFFIFIPCFSANLFVLFIFFSFCFYFYFIFLNTYGVYLFLILFTNTLWFGGTYIQSYFNIVVMLFYLFGR